ncbi:nitrous oxide reductase accessory protein NosL [Noviherbaspirillum sp.]|uniref:nitrous oxide reductase accessory protein NosL n=1 Tax=Noviherbaspirillum sp. TaxID=1926288 RepID=UPI0039C95C85
MNRKSWRAVSSRWIVGGLLVAALGACSQSEHKVAALEPKDDTACSLDGMILKDYAGPKAQIHYTEGQPDFFCDLMELFGVVLTPEQKRAVAAIYVQDMGKTDWDHPQGNWIDAKTAVYVVGSKKHGSMGPTFGSFSNEQDATAFAQKEGGKVLRFEQITTDMVSMGSSSAAHDDGMSH